jgi:hypothetical protein
VKRMTNISHHYANEVEIDTSSGWTFFARSFFGLSLLPAHTFLKRHIIIVKARITIQSNSWQMYELAVLCRLG